MGAPAEGKTKTKSKKRWRIGGIRSKSKAKASSTAEEDASATSATSTTEEVCPESSENSIVDGMQMSELFHTPMSDVDGDSINEDLYIDIDNKNNNSSKDSGENSMPLKAPQPMSGENGDDGNDDVRGNGTLSSIQLEEQNDDNQSCDSCSQGSYDEEMEEHESIRRSSPHFSDLLTKISEEPHYSHGSNDADDNNFDAKVHLDWRTNHRDKNENKIDLDKTLSTVSSNSSVKEISLPSHKEVSKELCKIVATEHYSGQESLKAIDKLSLWAQTQDSDLLKHLLTYGGVVKVVDFLNEKIEEAETCRRDLLIESIYKSADFLCNVCFIGKHGINEDIAVVNSTVVIKYRGIETLLQASQMYNISDNPSDLMALKAIESVWNAIMNVYCNADIIVTKAISTLVLDTSIETMPVLGPIDHQIADEAMANIFNCLYRIIHHGFVSKKEFQKKNLLNHCLGVFRHKMTSNEDCFDWDEELLEEALSFLYGCHEKSLFDKSTDFESMLPLCVRGLQEFAQENDNIREWATKLLDGCISNIEKKESKVIAEGAIEALAHFLKSKDVCTEEKDELRKLIRKIVAV